MWVHEAQAVYTRIDNYTATFHKQERVDGKLLEEETVLLKFKKPFKVYMRWTHMPHKGRELIYARDWNDNRMRAHEGGIIGIITMNLDPKGSLAMRGNRHPVTDTGIGHLLDVVAENLQKGTLTGELTLLDRGKETIYGKRTRRIQAIFPKDQTKGYYGYRVSVNFDVENRLPIKVEIHDWDDQLVEKYGYEDLKLNPGLTDSDFDPKNPEYRF
jgi:outer membrane lipoprotein-sorting protein